MITNTGKNIIGKYLLGQAPAYASYLAIGCGKKPLITGASLPDNSNKQNLDFEMFRVPISSRGLVNDNGVNKIVLTAELPTEERYELSEIGIYSAGSNSSAASFDSRTVFAFTQGENWQYHTSTAVSSIPTYLTALDSPAYDNVIAITDKVFQTNSDNVIFYKTPRKERYERCRFLNNIIMAKGNLSNLTTSNGHFVINSGSEHIHLTGTQNDFTKNAPTDELRLAFSLINKDGASSTIPDKVRILVDFSSTDETTGEFARFEAELVQGAGGVDFATNRYFVVSKQLQQLYTTGNFTWNNASIVKIYISVIKNNVTSDQYYVGIDAMRFENVTTLNPLYGLVGYSIIQTDDASTIIKTSNTTNYVEFRFSIGVT
jgi:hypothetical protein